MIVKILHDLMYQISGGCGSKYVIGGAGFLSSPVGSQSLHDGSVRAPSASGAVPAGDPPRAGEVCAAGRQGVQCSLERKNMASIVPRFADLCRGGSFRVLAPKAGS